jgi:hypothetical protein
MKGFIWNGDGFRDPAKHSLIKETVKTHKLDFIIISKTGRESFSAPFISNLAAGFAYHLEVDREGFSLESTMTR